MSAADSQREFASHSGAISVLLTEMNALIAERGSTGIDPAELEHVNGIKALIEGTILPTILAGVEQSRAEISALYQAILDCEAEHPATVSRNTSITQSSVEVKKLVHLECRKTESSLLEKISKACATVNRTRWAVSASGEDHDVMPPMTATDQAVIEHLKKMDDFFCGRHEVFRDQVTQCRTHKENFTIVRVKCRKLQKEFEMQHCAESSTYGLSCGALGTCWKKAARRFNDRKKELLRLEASRIEAYAAALSILCLWNAWTQNDRNCTVNRTQVEECHEMQPNTSMVSVQFPQLPTAPACSAYIGLEHPFVEMCSDEWFGLNYAASGLPSQVSEDIRATCAHCPTTAVAAHSAMVDVSSLKLVNMEHAAGNTYIRTLGGEGGGVCAAYVETLHANVQSVTVTPMNYGQKFKIEILADGNVTFSLVAENYVLVGGNHDVTFVYHDGDVLGLSLAEHRITYELNGQPIYTSNPVDVASGHGKVSLCSGPGESLHIDFVPVQAPQDRYAANPT